MRSTRPNNAAYAESEISVSELMSAVLISVVYVDVCMFYIVHHNVFDGNVYSIILQKAAFMPWLLMFQGLFSCVFFVRLCTLIAEVSFVAIVSRLVVFISETLIPVRFFMTSLT